MIHGGFRAVNFSRRNGDLIFGEFSARFRRFLLNRPGPLARVTGDGPILVVWENVQIDVDERGIVSVTAATGAVGRLVPSFERKAIVLYTIAVVLIILWLLGLATAYTMGGLIHVLLVIAIVVVLLRVISGRSPV